MERVEVESSVLASVGYEEGTLQLEFVRGTVYRYLDVPRRVYDELLAAPSHGEYFNEHVRDAYRFVRES